MCLKYFGLLFIINISYCHAFIIPEEVPSLLSLVYSNIPPIKKGTDSRFGVGFRLGEHADFQVLVELGPQKFIRPLGSASTTNIKRDADPEEFDNEPKPPKTAGDNWLSNWSVNAKQPEEIKKPETYMMPFIQEDSLRQLQKLYGMNSQASSNLNSLGTYPAQQQDELPFKMMMPILVQPTGNYQSKNQMINGKTKAKITADLMDVNLE